MVFMMMRKRFFHTHSCGFNGFQDRCKFRLEIHSLAAGLPMLFFLQVLRSTAGVLGVGCYFVWCTKGFLGYKKLFWGYKKSCWDKGKMLTKIQKHHKNYKKLKNNFCQKIKSQKERSKRKRKKHKYFCWNVSPWCQRWRFHFSELRLIDPEVSHIAPRRCSGRQSSRNPGRDIKVTPPR